MLYPKELNQRRNLGGSSGRGENMTNSQKLWFVIYIIGGVFCLFGGFTGLSAEATENTNPDWIFISIGFIGTLLFPSGSLLFSKLERFQRPTFSRSFIKWSSDPLQSIRFVVISTALYATGAIIAIPNADTTGKLMGYFYIAIALGIFLGERLAYILFRKRIDLL